MSGPELSVVVPSHQRPLRLRWLLNALEEQSLPHKRFEVVVAHDSGSATHEVLAGHPLARTGMLREIRVAPCGPARKRNLGWRAARAPFIAFTDDDCRPPPSWAQRALAAARARPEAIIQGTTRPDPVEAGLLRAAPWARSIEVEPTSVWAHTCNIVYPRALLERVGGFDEGFAIAAGEDADLAHRALAVGASLQAGPELLTYHAVEALSLAGRIRSAWRWRHLARAVARHPPIRAQLTHGIFWKPSHERALLAAAGLLLAARARPLALLAIPWLRAELGVYGRGPRGRARAAAELPGRAAIDAVEVAAMLVGSARNRTLLL